MKRSSLMMLASFLILSGTQYAVAGFPFFGNSDPKKTEQTQAIGTTASAYQVTESLPSFADLVDKLSPAVVNISTTSHISRAPMDEFFGNVPPEMRGLLQDFFGHSLRGQRQKQEVTSLGSGFVIDNSGYVVTNHHVVQGADKIEIKFPNGESYVAKLIGSDKKTDLALLKMNADKKFPALAWGNSDKARVGEWVLAIGNPYGLPGTVTKGIISALNRDIEAGPYDNFIQTDAAINKGNSGGPLFNLNGQVIGVNSAIISPSGGSVGVGFAIPASLAQNVINQLKNKGTVERGWIGVSIQEISGDLAKALGLEDKKGALVGDVTVGSPADKAGLKTGDLIVALNDKNIENSRDLPRLVAELPIDSKATIKIIRNQKSETLDLTIAKYPEDATQISVAQTLSGATIIKEMGVSLLDMSQALRKYGNMPRLAQGVFVDDVSQEASGALQKGDIILEVSQMPIQNVKDFVQKFDKLRQENKNPILLRINRQGVSIFVAVRLP